jgi:hypothetical protein
MIADGRQFAKPHIADGFAVLVTIRVIIKRHGPVVALDGTNLDIASGELVTLREPFASGKIIRCVLRRRAVLVPPQSAAKD